MTVIFWLAARLPLAWAQTVGDLIGGIIGWLPGRYRQRLQDNYRQAMPNATPDDLRRAARSAGRMMMEMPFFWMRRHPLRAITIAADAYDEVVPALQAQGKGVIFLSPHLGGYELLGPWLAERGKFTVLFKPPKQAFLKTWVEEKRAGPNLAMAPANYRGVRMLLKALKRGESVGILPDQCPPGGEGEWAPFFDRQAYTMTLVQRLQGQTGAPIVLIFAERLAQRAHFKIHLNAMTHALPTDPQAAVAVLNQHVETLVRIAPHQYLWGYNRYKRPRGATPPPAPAADR